MKIVIKKTAQKDIFNLSFTEPTPNDSKYLFTIKEPLTSGNALTALELLEVSFSFKKGDLDKILILLEEKNGTNKFIEDINIQESILDAEKDGVAGIDIA